MSEKATREIVMSGMRATGALHIGHYFGALKNWIQLQDQHECFFGVMDWHALTTHFKNPEGIAQSNRVMMAEYIAAGVDPDKCVLFIQSQVPEHLELYFIFSTLTPMGWLERVPTWKDAEEEMRVSDTHNLGRFSYPVLQAADISVYAGTRVPVGPDQVSHLELSREIVRRWNHLFKGHWPEPKPLLMRPQVVPGLDGRKMSKTYGNSILLFEESKDLQKKIRGMPTDPARIKREDPGEPSKCTVYSYHQLFSSAEDLSWVESGCRTAGIGCGDCKGRLIENIEKVILPLREKKKEFLNNPTRLDSIVKEGCRKARERASRNLSEIKKQMKWPLT